jgi:hypothetical protein
MQYDGCVQKYKCIIVMYLFQSKLIKKNFIMI